MVQHGSRIQQFSGSDSDDVLTSFECGMDVVLVWLLVCLFGFCCVLQPALKESLLLVVAFFNHPIPRKSPEKHPKNLSSHMLHMLSFPPVSRPKITQEPLLCEVRAATNVSLEPENSRRPLL